MTPATPDPKPPPTSYALVGLTAAAADAIRPVIDGPPDRNTWRRHTDLVAALCGGSLVALDVSEETDCPAVFVDYRLCQARDGRLAAAVAMNKELLDQAAVLRAERNTAAALASDGAWFWSEHNENDLASMSDGMTVIVTAGNLRRVIGDAAAAERTAIAAEEAPFPSAVGNLIAKVGCECNAGPVGVHTCPASEAEREWEALLHQVATLKAEVKHVRSLLPNCPHRCEGAFHDVKGRDRCTEWTKLAAARDDAVLEPPK